MAPGTDRHTSLCIPDEGKKLTTSSTDYCVINNYSLSLLHGLEIRPRNRPAFPATDSAELRASRDSSEPNCSTEWLGAAYIFTQSRQRRRLRPRLPPGHRKPTYSSTNRTCVIVTPTRRETLRLGQSINTNESHNRSENGRHRFMSGLVYK